MNFINASYHITHESHRQPISKLQFILLDEVRFCYLPFLEKRALCLKSLNRRAKGNALGVISIGLFFSVHVLVSQ